MKLNLYNLLILFTSLMVSLFHQVSNAKDCSGNMRDSSDWVGLNKLIADTDRPSSLDEFIACLPPDFFSFNAHTFVTQSLSPEKKHTSEAFPRVILFGKDTSIIVAYEGHGDVGANEAARIIRTNEHGDFEFYELKFENKLRLVPEANNRCQRCHGGKPIWGSYRNWAGTFGPNSDLQWLTKDIDGYDKFSSPRYSRVVAGIGGDDYQIAPEDLIPSRPDFKPRQPYTPGSGYFLDRLVPGQSKFILNQLKRSKTFPKIKYLLAATFLGCELPANLKSNLDRVLAHTFSSAEITEMNGKYFEFDRTALKIELLGRAMGVTESTWSLIFEPFQDNDHEDRVAFSLGSGVNISDYVFRELAKEIGNEQPSLVPLFTSPRWASPYYSFLNSRYHDRIPDPYPKDFAMECRALAPFVVNEYKQNNSQIVFLSSEFKPRNFTTLAMQCTSCHAGEMGQAPLIPFYDSTALKKWMVNYDPSGSGVLAKKLLREKIKVGSMPLDRPLLPEQRALLIQEVDRL
jgi:hypothetical protein